jgi:hypothetical protein
LPVLDQPLLPLVGGLLAAVEVVVLVATAAGRGVDVAGLRHAERGGRALSRLGRRRHGHDRCLGLLLAGLGLRRLLHGEQLLDLKALLLLRGLLPGLGRRLELPLGRELGVPPHARTLVLGHLHQRRLRLHDCMFGSVCGFGLDR